ncbi:MAG TPA: prolipoprotein diacylglyceryl transferase [Streptosporangiaceae bacterium]|nr:prolipoprotein diacylglyceryl transferase [Streptosporangiaceae bacterium]
MAAEHRLPALSFIPSPSSNGIHIGPLFIHYYGLMYVIGITLAVIIARRRLMNAGGDPTLIADMATWAVPAGIIGGRIYFDITTPAQIPHEWYGVFAVWSGGLGIWGGVLAGALVGAWRVRRRGGGVAIVADAVAPGLLVAQAIGRIGNYFNQELFGKPSTLPWALMISPHVAQQAGYPGVRTFQPTFLYELIWDLALAAILVWLGHHRTIRPPGLFALYVTGYSAFRIFEETLRVDYSQHILGLRLNLFVASALTIVGLVWFIITQRRTPATVTAAETGTASTDTPPESTPAAGTEPSAETSDAAAETSADGAAVSASAIVADAQAEQQG